MAVARMLGVVYSLTLLCLMSAAQAGPNNEVTRPSPEEAFHNVLEIVKAEVRQEIDILNKTRIELFEVSRLIPKPQKGYEGDHKVDACQLVKMDITSEAVAEAFEVFTQHLNPWGNTVILSHTFHELECFARAQAKLSSGQVPLRNAGPPRPAVTSYLKVLEKRLHTNLFRLYLLNNMIVTHLPTDLPPSAHDQTLNISRTRPTTRQPPGTHFYKLFNKKQMPSLTFKNLAKNIETTEVSTKVSEFENLKTLMNNLRQILGHTQPSNSISLLPSGHGPYCKGITITGPAHAIMKQMLTEASNAALQLENAAVASEIKDTRKELRCQMGEVAKFAAVWSPYIDPYKVTGILDTIDSKLRDLINKQGRMAAKILKQDDKTRNIPNPRKPIKKTKVNIFQDVELHPRCCD